MMPRIVNDKDISIPASFGFVIKRLADFDTKECSFVGTVTVIIRIKCTGLPNKNQIIDHNPLYPSRRLV